MTNLVDKAAYPVHTKGMNVRHSDIQTLNDLIGELIANRFYGEVLVKFEAGHIVVCKKTETIKF